MRLYPGVILTALLAVLKVQGLITCAWWMVAMPLWLPPMLVVGYGVLAGLCCVGLFVTMVVADHYLNKRSGKSLFGKMKP
jgi:hypothetical protein